MQRSTLRTIIIQITLHAELAIRRSFCDRYIEVEMVSLGDIDSDDF